MTRRIDQPLTELIEESRDAYEPSIERRARAHWALESKLASMQRSRKSSIWGNRTRVGLAGAVLLAAAGAYAGVNGALGGGPENRPVPLPTAAVNEQTRIEPVTLEKLTSEEVDASTDRHEVQATAPLSAPEVKKVSSLAKKNPSESMRAELEALRSANSALRANQPGRAIEILDQYQREHQVGVLGQERAAARVVALCASGRTSEGQSQARSFLKRFPSSPQISRITSSCSLFD